MVTSRVVGVENDRVTFGVPAAAAPAAPMSKTTLRYVVWAP